MRMDQFSSQDDFDESAAKTALEIIRWGYPVRPVCPRCKTDDPIKISTRKVYRCRFCRHHYTVTSGTVFDRHKLSYAKLLKAMLWYEENGRDGKPADLARLLGCSWKTAYVMKLRLWEGYMASPSAFFETGPFFARWYWQGYNLWTNENDNLARRTKHGAMRYADAP